MLKLFHSLPSCLIIKVYLSLLRVTKGYRVIQERPMKTQANLSSSLILPISLSFILESSLDTNSFTGEVTSNASNVNIASLFFSLVLWLNLFADVTTEDLLLLEMPSHVKTWTFPFLRMCFFPTMDGCSIFVVNKHTSQLWHKVYYVKTRSLILLNKQRL